MPPPDDHPEAVLRPRGLPGHGGPDLAAGQAQRLQHGELARAPAVVDQHRHRERQGRLSQERVQRRPVLGARSANTIEPLRSRVRTGTEFWNPKEVAWFAS